MCGIFGWNVKPHITKRRRKKFGRLITALTVQNATRGDDSWGFYTPQTDRRVVGLGDISCMILKARKIFFNSNIVIAHTRKATTGTISHDNCHPFRVGSLVGAHNGIVFNHHTLNTEYKRQCEVDSQHLFYHLAEGRELSDIVSYGAIHMHDKSSSCPVQMGRFNEGELAICKIANVGVFWSSDWDHLERAVAAAGWPTDGMQEPEQYFLYTVSDSGIDIQDVIEPAAPQWKTQSDKWNAYSSTGCYSSLDMEDNYPSTESCKSIIRYEEPENRDEYRLLSQEEIDEIEAEERRQRQEDAQQDIPPSAYPDDECGESWPY